MNKVLTLLLVVSACTRHEPPAWDAGPWGSHSVAPLVLPPDEAGRAAAVMAADGERDAGTSDAAATPMLGQTRDRPTESKAFEVRMQMLWQAMLSGDAESALDAFFPVDAYTQVKDVSDPERDWKRRLVAAYKRDIADIHVRFARLADGGTRAHLVRIEVPSERARWVEPGEEYNKLGYYRVFGTKIHYEVDHKPRTIEVKSLISWRGEWYVVHLSGMH